MLITLPYRFSQKEFPSIHSQVDDAIMVTPDQTQTDPIRNVWINDEVLSAILSLGAETDPQELGFRFTEIIGRSLRADICLLMMASDDVARLKLAFGTDLATGKRYPNISLIRKGSPILAASFEYGRFLRLSGRSSAPDLAKLSWALDLPRSGALLAVPLVYTGYPLLIELVLIRPYSNRNWNPQDKDRTIALAKPLIRFLHLKLSLINGKPEETGIPLSDGEIQQEIMVNRVNQELAALIAWLQQGGGGEISSESAAQGETRPGETGEEGVFLEDKPENLVGQEELATKLHLKEGRKETTSKPQQRMEPDQGRDNE